MIQVAAASGACTGCTFKIRQEEECCLPESGGYPPGIEAKTGSQRQSTEKNICMQAKNILKTYMMHTYS